MHWIPMTEELATLRHAEREQQSLHTWEVEHALSETRYPARAARGFSPLLRRAALRAAWRLTRLAGADTGLYTVKDRATLVDAHGTMRTVCPDEIYFVLLPRTDRDAA